MFIYVLYFILIEDPSENLTRSDEGLLLKYVSLLLLLFF